MINWCWVFVVSGDFLSAIGVATAGLDMSIVVLVVVLQILHFL